MRAGKLRHNIIIQKRAVPATRDTHGQIVDNWVTHAAIRADLSPIMGRELVAAASVENVGTATIYARYYPGVTAQMRIKYVDLKAGGTVRYFNIIAPPRSKDERGREMEISVEEGLVNG